MPMLELWSARPLAAPVPHHLYSSRQEMVWGPRTSELQHRGHCLHSHPGGTRPSHRASTLQHGDCHIRTQPSWGIPAPPRVGIEQEYLPTSEPSPAQPELVRQLTASTQQQPSQRGDATHAAVTAVWRGGGVGPHSRGEQGRGGQLTTIDAAEWRNQQDQDPDLEPLLQWLEDQERA
ncbi:UNVERIFIED_CONTAM: hypothetical protein FKN15_027573 [Acipenser sinensis]